MKGIIKVLNTEGKGIDDLESQEQFDQDVSLMTNPEKIEDKIGLENRFKRYTRVGKCLNYSITAVLAALPVGAYVNPDFNGIENVVATTLGIFSAITIPTLWYAGHFGDYPKLEREYERRVDVLETRLRDLKQNE